MENFLKVNFNPVSKNKDKYLEVKAELTHVENPRLKRFLNEDRDYTEPFKRTRLLY